MYVVRRDSGASAKYPKVRPKREEAEAEEGEKPSGMTDRAKHARPRRRGGFGQPLAGCRRYPSYKGLPPVYERRNNDNMNRHLATVTFDTIQNVNAADHPSTPEIIVRTASAVSATWWLLHYSSRSPSPVRSPLLVLSTFNEQAVTSKRSDLVTMFSRDELQWWSPGRDGDGDETGLVWKRRDGCSLAYIRGLSVDGPHSIHMNDSSCLNVSAVMFTPIPHASEPGRDRIRAAFRLAHANGHDALVFDSGILSCTCSSGNGEAGIVASVSEEESGRAHGLRPPRVFCSDPSRYRELIY